MCIRDRELNGHGTNISEVPGLTVVNLDPEKAAAEYRESVISPYRGKLPESVFRNMEEQLSGSCTVSYTHLINHCYLWLLWH